MFNLEITRPAEADLLAVLDWSQNTFGELGRRRYEALIATALRDIRDDPRWPGVKPRDEIAPAIMS